MKIAILVMWLLVFVVDTISAVMGNDPSWILVYCPLITLIIYCIGEVIEEYFD